MNPSVEERAYKLLAEIWNGAFQPGTLSSVQIRNEIHLILRLKEIAHKCDRCLSMERVEK